MSFKKPVIIAAILALSAAPAVAAPPLFLIPIEFVIVDKTPQPHRPWRWASPFHYLHWRLVH